MLDNRDEMPQPRAARLENDELQTAMMYRSQHPSPALALGISFVLLVSLPPCAILPAAAADHLIVELTIPETKGIDRDNVAVSSGLPVEKGRLNDASSLVARTLSGTTMASQFDVLVRWDDGSVKWGLLSVVVPELKAHSEFRFSLIETRSPVERAGPEIHKLNGAVRVEYPALSVKTNGFGLPQSVSFGDGDNASAVVRGDTRLLLRGKPVKAEEAQLEDVRIEEQGPLRTVIRSQGQISLDEETSFGFLSRITIFANGQISTSYTVINHQVGGFHGFGVQLDLVDGFENVLFDEATVPLHQNGAGEADRADTVGVRQTSSESAVFYGGEFDGNSVRAHHHGGMWLSGKSKNLGLAIHDFWQRYPSELAVTANRVQLWFYAEDSENPSPLYQVGRAARGEFTIKAGTVTSPNWSPAQLGQTDLHAFAGPQWYLDSGVLGQYALGAFKLSSGTYNGHVQELLSYLQRRKFLVNEFGFWDFGDGRDSADTPFRRNNEFGISYAMLFHYLRTGDVSFFEEGIAFAKHFRDVDTLHFGTMQGKSIRHTDNHVDGGTGYDMGHQWVEGMLLDYLLTGDRRGLEVAREMAIPLIEFSHHTSSRLKAKPHTISTNERNLGWTLLSLMFLEEVTGDTQHADAIQALIEGVVASQDQERGHWPRSLPHPDFPTGGSSFMLGVLTEALMRYHEKTGDPAVARSIVKSSYWLSDEMWNPEEKNIRYKQWDQFWDHYNDGRTIPMILPGMIYAEHLGRNELRYRQIIDDTLQVYARSCADLDNHGEGRVFKSMGMMSRSMPRFFYYYEKARNR